MKLRLTFSSRWWSDIGLGTGYAINAKNLKQMIRNWISNSPPSKEK